MLRIEISAESVEAFREHVADLYSMVFGALNQQALPAAPEAEAPAPVKRTRKPKVEETVVQTVELTAAGAATTATAESLFCGAPAQQAPAPVEQPKPKATQAHLINAFRNLANAKGTDPIVALLGEYKSKSVAAIPEAVWPSAIESAAKLAGLTYQAAIVEPAKS